MPALPGDPTTQPMRTSLRGVVDDGKGEVTSLVYGSNYKSTGTDVTERRGNLRAPGHPEFGHRAVSTPMADPRERTARIS